MLRIFFVLALLCVMPFGARAQEEAAATKTPIKHVIVVFQENVSFDHYFGSYPKALNLLGETAFNALPATPSVDGLTEDLLKRNPNKANLIRLAPQQAATCDMDHTYTDEQKAFDGGRMDKFVENTKPADPKCDPTWVMAYFDGNTVMALWNYAQHFAMSDRFFGTTFGPSTPGALNLVSGNSHSAAPPDGKAGEEITAAQGTVIGDPDPFYDDCSSPKAGIEAVAGRNVGDLLNEKHVSWGWFQGGFRATKMAEGKAVCGAVSTNLVGALVPDYSPHHEPFQYYAQSANPHHLPPSSPDRIGQDDQARHQYDLADFETVLAGGRLPAVSFVKAKRFQDGHAGYTYSNPVDEQPFLVGLINRIMQSPYWRDTAIIVTYDDSDGWYDHAAPPIVNGSALPGIDALDGPGKCGDAKPGAYPGRCGYGPRLPLLILSTYAKSNYVDHNVTDQTSILRFIEDNWALGRIGDQSLDVQAGTLETLFDFARSPAKPLILDPKTGAITP